MTFNAKTIAATALIALGAAVPAAADVAPGPAAAIAEFNMMADTQDGVRMLKSGANGVAISTRSGSKSRAFEIFNANADSQDGIRGQNGATAFGGTPSRGAAIFAAINAANADDE